jgi:hypothetical protein
VVETHGFCTSLTRVWLDLMRSVAGYQRSDYWWRRLMSDIAMFGQLAPLFRPDCRFI